MTAYDIEEFTTLSRIQVNENSIRYELEAAQRPSNCPVCGSTQIKQHGVRARKVRDLSEHGLLVGLVIHVHRYLCKICGNSWTDTFKSIPTNGKITVRMNDYIREQALKRPFLNIAEELSVSVATVKRCFEEYVAEKEEQREILAPIVLGLDENYLNGKYRGVYVDIENGLIIDMTMDRNLRTVQNWLEKLPGKERIKCVTTDMWGPYKEAINNELPDTPIVVDKFHVIKHLNESLDRIRKRLRETLPKGDRVYLKNSRWLLLRNREDLDASSQMRLHALLNNFSSIRQPYQLKESFRQIYKATSRKEAEELFIEWRKEACSYAEFSDFILMVENWHTEIFNYFDYQYTNATTESLNRLAKEVSAKGRGYNFEVLRAKMLYGNRASKQAKYQYYETEQKPDLSFMIETDIPQNKLSKIAMAYSRIISGAGTNIEELFEDIQKGEVLDFIINSHKK